MWNVTQVSKILGIKYPIVLAPMAGGPSTPELVASVSESGGLGSVGAGYMNPEQLQDTIQAVKKLTDKSFAVNIFVSGTYQVDDEKVKKAVELMRPYRNELGMKEELKLELPNDHFREHIETVIQNGISVVSFTFGLPEQNVIDELKSAGIKVLGTATTVNEAVDMDDHGIDIVVAQGSESGGHRGSYLRKAEDSLIGTMTLVPQVADSIDKPIIAAGGIMDGRGIAAALCLGASGVQMGTAFLTCSESGATDMHKDAILRSREDQTTLTRVFSGKLARGLRNRFTEEIRQHESTLPDYPVQNFLTRPIRKASADKKITDFMSLWSGQGVRLSRSLPAAELMSKLVGEVNSVFKKFQ